MLEQRTELTITCEVDASDAGCVPVAGSCRHISETSNSNEGRKFVNEMTDHQRLKQDSVPRVD